MSDEIVAIPLAELNATKFMLGPKKTKTWNFKDKATGKPKAGSQTFVNVYYENPGDSLCFVLDDVKSYSGMQMGQDLKSGFMSLSFQKELSDKVRAAVDTPLFNLAFHNRKELFSKMASKISQPGEMRVLYDGVVSDGKEKTQGSGDYWDDSLVANIPMKRVKQQPVVDTNLCRVEDVDGKEYSVNALDGKKLKEVVVQVDRMVFTDRVRIYCNYRLIVVDEKAAPKVTTRRRLEQSKTAAAASESSESGSGDKSSTNSTANTPTPPAAPSDAKATDGEPAARRPKPSASSTA